MKYALIVSVFFFVHSVHAASDTFTTHLQIISTDTTPPSVPVNIITTPVSQSQIDLTWDTSTDNVLVSGYQVFRGGSQIATTTLTSYSDTGLTATTLYVYEITAFDSSTNISSSSASSSATTLASSTLSTSGGGASIEPVETDIDNFLVTTTRDSAHIVFDTNIYTSALYRWGRTQNYENGYIASTLFKKRHSTLIAELEPGTIYELEIVLTRRFTGEEVIKRVQFTTKSAEDVIAPANVMNVKALYENSAVLLTWDTPVDSDFEKVRIISNDVFYPTDSTNGWFVYEGTDSQVKDRRNVQNAVRYYTIFSYDTAGNISSGAVVAVYMSKGAQNVAPVAVRTSSDQKNTQLEQLRFSDFLFIQKGYTDASSPSIEIGVDTTISIPYAALPEHLKTIVVTLEHPEDEDRMFSFLLKVNKDKTAYEAVIGGLDVIGSYTTTFEVFDFNTKQVTRVSGSVTTILEQSSERFVTATTSFFTYVVRMIVFILVILTGYLLWVVYKRKSEDNTL